MRILSTFPLNRSLSYPLFTAINLTPANGNICSRYAPFPLSTLRVVFCKQKECQTQRFQHFSVIFIAYIMVFFILCKSFYNRIPYKDCIQASSFLLRLYLSRDSASPCLPGMHPLIPGSNPYNCPVR